MKHLSKLLPLPLVLALMGCFPRAPYIQQPQPPTGAHRLQDEAVSANRPATGVTTTASVGAPIMVSGSDRVSYHADVSSSSVAEGDYTLYGEKDFRFKLQIPAGRFAIEYEDIRGDRFASAGLVPAEWTYQGKFYDTSRVTVHFRIKKAGGVDVAWSQDSDPAMVYTEVPGLAEKVAIGIRAVPDASALRRELVYTGRSGSNLTLLYREFINDMARPAFSQQLQYDIGNDPVIGYQGARFRVLDANNTSITYEVLSAMQAK